MSNLLIDDKDLINIWNYSRNENVDINKITLSSNKKVWWKCSLGHEWEALVCNVSKSKNCPYCTNRRILIGYNDFQTLFPDIASEWDYEKNDKKPFEFSKTSEEKVWWICPNGHSYYNRIDTRVRGVKCPYCDGREKTFGLNDIVTLYPIIDEYWNYNKNKENPRDLKIGDSKSYNWICSKCGYEWHTRIGHIIKDFSGCRNCNKGNNIIKGNKLINSEIIQEWDYEKNINLNPNKLSKNCKEKAWWKCEKGHSYYSRIESRSRGTGCPICNNSEVLKGYNDALTLIPKIKDEWDYEKNDILPTELTSGSSKEVHFICPKGHYYKMKMADYSKGYNCPVCSNRIIISGINDLASFDDRVTSEWHPTKNGDLKPTDISFTSNKKVWWLGKCGHEWEARIYSRTMQKTNCPVCAEERHASVSEKSVLYYLKKSNKYDLIYENYTDNNVKLELDIYIPSINTAIEYDGERWHRNIEKDLRKDRMCDDNNIKLIRIRENGCPDYFSNSKKIFLSINKTKGLEQGINELLKYLDIKNIDVDIERDTTDILSMINFMVKENSISVTHPKIAKEWHPTKNGNLKPEHTKQSSNKIVWWICPNGHEYQLDVYHRTLRGNGCTICSSHKVLCGYNDLLSQTPNLAKEWHPTKNGDLKPCDVTFKSGKKVWWLGKCGHEWEDTISHRNGSNRGCPYCSGNRVLKGFNDIATTNPDLIKEWNYDKNLNISPTELSSHSGKKVWWKCLICNNEWEATIDKRNNGRGCPKCARYKSSSKRIIKLSTPIIQMDKNGNFINEFPSIREAIRQTGCHGINDVISGKYKQSGGYYWKIKD